PVMSAASAATDPDSRNAAVSKPSLVMEIPFSKTSTGRRALDAQLQHVKRLRGGDEQMIALGPAEAEIGGAFRQTDAAQDLALRAPHRNAGITQHRVGAGPDISGPIGAHAVGMAIDAIDHAVGELMQIFDAPIHHIANMN